MCFNNGVTPHRVRLLPLRATDYLTKTPMPSIRNLSSNCWSEDYKSLPDKMDYCSCLPELEGKTLLLMTPHTSDTELRGIELKLTWKPSPWGLVLIVKESAMPAANGEKQSYPAMSHMIHNDWTSKIAPMVKQWPCILEVANNCLTVLKAHPIRGDSFLVL